MTEIHEGRIYSEFDPSCNFCESAAVWHVWEDEVMEDQMLVCEKHKYTAFS